jgi:hypothetical protein
MTKLTARRMGISPIWYVNQTPGFDWKATPAVNALKKRAVDEGKFHKDPIAQLTPYVSRWAPGRRTRGRSSGGSVSGAFCSRLERVSRLRPQRRPRGWVSELCSARRQGTSIVAPRLIELS